MTLSFDRAYRLFVYGTLRRDQRNHHYLGGSEMLGTCSTEASFMLIDAGGFPAALLGGKQQVTGEVYRVNDAVLSRIDRLEGHPDFFDRGEIDTLFGACWIYLYRQAIGSEPVIDSGDWLRN